MDLIGKLVVVSVSPAYRDTIYVGVVTEIDEDWLVLRQAKNIVCMRGRTGLGGHSASPHEDSTVHDVLALGGVVAVRSKNINVVLLADRAGWGYEAEDA